MYTFRPWPNLRPPPLVCLYHTRPHRASALAVLLQMEHNYLHF